MEKIRYIVTDLNGTLIDAMPTYTRVFRDVLRRRAGLDLPDITEYVRGAAGTPWDEQFAAVLEKNQRPKDAVPEMMDEFCSLVAEEKYSLYPGTEELLRLFREKGCKIYITSASGTGAMVRRIYEMGILPYVDFLLGFDVYKKSPKHILMLAEKERLPLPDFTSQAVYFGDGPGDMRIAEMCGIYTIGVAQTVSREKLLEAGADLVIDRLAEALTLDFDKLKK
jgi:phosphoglycolate phosphatase